MLLQTSQQLRGLLFVSRPRSASESEARVVAAELSSISTSLVAGARPVTLRTSEILYQRPHRRRHVPLHFTTPSAVPAHTLAIEDCTGSFLHINCAHHPAVAHRGHLPTNTTTMSLVNLAHVCSHLQNASKARLGLTSIPVSKLHVKLALGLQQEGFLSSVTLAGATPPTPFLLQEQPDPEELDVMARKLQEEPWLAYAANRRWGSEELVSKGPRPTSHVPDNPGRRRLWLGLKYWNNEPVLKNMKLVSKPTRRIWLTSEDLGKITRTRESSYVKGLTHPGECMFITTDRGILEARECVERRLGGMALCRVWG